MKDALHLKDVLREAVKQVQAGNVVVVDVRVLPGYDTNMGGTPPARR